MDGRIELGISRRNPQTAIKSSLYTRIKADARKRKLDFSLDKEHFYMLCTSNCFYCDSSPSARCYPTVKKGGRKGKSCIDYSRPSLYNGLDRLDATKGYFEENVVACCKKCNWAKNDMSCEEFYEWVRKVHKKLSSISLKIVLRKLP